jgi:hypothetical protein
MAAGTDLTAGSGAPGLLRIDGSRLSMSLVQKPGQSTLQAAIANSFTQDLKQALEDRLDAGHFIDLSLILDVLHMHGEQA